MSTSRQLLARRLAIGVFAALGIVLNVVDQFVLNGAVPNSDFGSYVLAAAVGTSFAVCAVVASELSTLIRPTVLMLIGSVVWTFGTFSDGLADSSWVWAPLWAFQGGVDVLVVWLALAYPSGILSTRLARAVVAVAAGVYAITIASRLFVGDPGVWGQCGCVPNPLALYPSQSLFGLLDLFAPYGNLLIAVLALVAVALRWARGSDPWRAVNVLMALVFLLLALVWIVFDFQTLTTVDYGGDSDWPTYLRGAATAAIPIVYVASLLGLRSTRARVADLILGSRGGVDREVWVTLVREALDDRHANVLWWDSRSGGYVDSAAAPAPDPRSSVTPNSTEVLEVESPAGPIALICHDPALSNTSELMASVAEALRLSSENVRLTNELTATLASVRESRARIVSSADAARRGIERDLHDGAQQFLVALGFDLRSATREAQRAENPTLVEELARASEHLSRALTELRELARGITPTVLSHGGVRGAAEDLAHRCPVPTTVRTSGDIALSQLTQATIYFLVAEGLTNVAKHSAADAASVSIDLADVATVTISDNGVGGASANFGSGLRGLFDRVEATGGSVRVDSQPGRGTTIVASLPLTDVG
jgi:signal transduction histidine kinase